MAKRKGARRGKASPKRRKRVPAPRSVKRPKRKPRAGHKKTAQKKSQAKKSTPARKRVARPRSSKPKSKATPATSFRSGKKPRLDRVRRTLDEIVPTPPSSLRMDRHGSAARTGRAELAESRVDHGAMAAVTGGDVDVNVEDAYFAGEEAPGGDNPTPDQDVVDEIGKALGLEYADHEELKGSDKITERDRHRWEMDPASSEDYKDRK